MMVPWRSDNQIQAAIIHDWLVEFGGAEQILAALLEIWPQAPVYTMIFDPAGQCADLLTGRTVIPSILQKFPGATRRHRSLLPLMPLAVEQFDLRAYNLLVSLSYAVAHGVLTRPDQLHLNYICTPVRYAWHLYFQYLEEGRLTRGLKSWIARSILHYLRLWDVAAANRVDDFVAISHWVARNVWRVYRRQAAVIYPPVDVEACEPCSAKDDYYLVVSRLVPYKKIDLIVDAFSQLTHKSLLVIGDGPELPRLQARAGKNVQFLGYQPVEAVRDAMRRARAFLFAAEEDFGITAVEAQACGTPVIAFGKGGALETVIEGQTGLFFYQQTPESLLQAIHAFEALPSFELGALRQNAERFSKERFLRQFRQHVDQKWESFSRMSHE